jgi:hypothetical protein
VYKKVILDIVGNGTLFLTVQGDTSAIRIPAGLTSAAIKLKVCVKPKLTPEMLKHGSFDVALQKGEGTNPGGGLVLSTVTLELVPKTLCKTFTVQASTADDFYIDYKLDEDQMRHLRPIHPLLRTQLRAIGHVTTPASSKVFVAVGQKSAFLTIALSAPVAKGNTLILRLLLDPKGVQIAGNADSSFEIVFGDEEAEKKKVSNKNNGEEENGGESSLLPQMRSNHPNPSQQIQFLGIQPGTWVIKYELLDGYSNDHFTCAKNVTVIVTPGPSPSPRPSPSPNAWNKKLLLWSCVFATSCLLVVGTYTTLLRGKVGSIQKIGRRSGCGGWYYIILPPLSFVASLGTIGYSVLTLCTMRPAQSGGHFMLHVFVVSMGLVVSLGTVCYAINQMHRAYRRVSAGLHTQTSEGVLSDFILEWYQRTTVAGGDEGEDNGIAKRVTCKMVQDFLLAQRKLQVKKEQSSAARKERRETVLQVIYFAHHISSCVHRYKYLYSQYYVL